MILSLYMPLTFMRFLTHATSLIIFIAISYTCQQVIQPIDNKTTANKNILQTKKTPKQYDKPGEAAAWVASMRRTPKGMTTAELNLKFMAEIKATKAQKTNQNLPPLYFEEMGPGVFGGRIRGFVIHPERAGHLLAGGVSGGVWKSTDDGQSWQPKADFLENIAIGSMLIDPDNPEKIYLGTGEGFFNFDAARGNGIFVSEDFGNNWTQLESTTGSDFHYVNRLARIPGSNVLMAATGTGIFRSTDLGLSWTEVSGHETTERGFVDLKLDPSDPNHLLASHFGNSNDVVQIQISTPNTINGSNVAIPAGFGPEFDAAGVSGELAPATYSNGANYSGCQAITSDVNNKIAVMQRGGCNFTDKVKNAQNAGASAAIIVQSTNEPAFTMGGEDDSITIPAAMVDKDFGDGVLLSTVTLQANIVATVTDPLQRFVMRSTNQGATWQILDADDGLPENDVERIEIGFGTDGTTYLAISSETTETQSGNITLYNGTRGLWKSIGPDHLSFNKTNSTTNFIERQGWYDLAIAVNPHNSNHVIMGAIDQFATTNGGSSITKRTYWFSPPGYVSKYIHADHHGYFFSPHNNSHIYVVSDGGVAKSEDNGATWLALNNGLNISQSYGIAVSPDGKNITSGTQDNGSQLYFGNRQTWLEWQGGDGGYSAWDQQQGNYVYGSYVNGQMYGSNNGGMSAVNMPLPDTEGARFIQPFELDEHNGNRMLVGTDNVFFTNNARSLNNAAWQDVSGSINGSGVSAVAFNPHQNTTAYAGMSDSDLSGNFQIIKITGLGTSNSVTDIAPPASMRVAESVVTDIKVDIFDSSGNTLYATFGDYKINRILRSTDGGNNWMSIANNLPPIPLYQISNDPTDPNTLYLGSELGLWIGSKSGNTYNWQQFDYGPAFTRVVDLVWNNNDLYVGTHGRGTYKASKNAIAVSVVKFIATNSSCDVDNFLDRGEAGKLLVEVTNQSAIDFGQVSLAFNEPNFIDFTAANQNTSLAGWASKIIELPVSLSTQANCLADLTVPVTISTDAGTFNTELSITTAANQLTSTGTFTDGAESAESQLKSVLALGNDGWVRVTDRINSGNHSWFTTNENTYSDKSLVTPWLTFDAGGNVLNFALSYNTEGDSSQYWDGLVLEMRLKDMEHWFDIGHLSSIPYDGQLNTNNTAQAQFAWSGTQLTWRQASVDLGTEYVGKTAQIRFRMVSDTNSAMEGFWLDDLSISNVITQLPATCDACISDNNSVVPNKGLWYDPAFSGHGFIIEAVGRDSLYYTMFYTYDDAGNPEWYNSVTALTQGVLNEGFSAGSLEKPKYNHAIEPADGFPLFADPALTDGRITINFNAQDIINHPACQDGTARQLAYAALATWTINNDTQTWCIEPLIADNDRPNPDYGTSWYAGGSDTGWGYSLAQNSNQMIAYLFYYDGEGNARWALSQEPGFVDNSNFNMTMFNPLGYGRQQPKVPLDFTEIGHINLHLSNLLRNPATDGRTDINVTYPGAEGGSWIRQDLPILNLMAPH